MAPYFPWSATVRERVMALLRDGFSCSGIAEALGGDMTRNQIAGRVYRNAELKACRPPTEPSRRARRPKTVKDPNAPKKPTVVPPLPERGRIMPSDPLRIQTRASDPPREPVVLPPRLAPRVRRPEMRLITLPELGGYGHECRWPAVEDMSVVGHVLFCAAPTPEGKSYCPYHQEVAQPGSRAQQPAAAKPGRPSRPVDSFRGA